MQGSPNSALQMFIVFLLIFVLGGGVIALFQFIQKLNRKRRLKKNNPKQD